MKKILLSIIGIYGLCNVIALQSALQPKNLPPKRTAHQFTPQQSLLATTHEQPIATSSILLPPPVSTNIWTDQSLLTIQPLNSTAQQPPQATTTQQPIPVITIAQLKQPLEFYDILSGNNLKQGYIFDDNRINPEPRFTIVGQNLKLDAFNNFYAKNPTSIKRRGRYARTYPNGTVEYGEFVEFTREGLMQYIITLQDVTQNNNFFAYPPSL